MASGFARRQAGSLILNPTADCKSERRLGEPDGSIGPSRQVLGEDGGDGGLEGGAGPGDGARAAAGIVRTTPGLRAGIRAGRRRRGRLPLPEQLLVAAPHACTRRRTPSRIRRDSYLCQETLFPGRGRVCGNSEACQHGTKWQPGSPSVLCFYAAAAFGNRTTEWWCDVKHAN